jgi:hypothetical protein
VRIVKLVGDGTPVEFASAVNAVGCAIEIQRQLREHYASVSAVDPIRFRIGINVGNIIIEGDDILGDGVNVAARIEGVPNLAAFRSPRTHDDKFRARSRPSRRAADGETLELFISCESSYPLVFVKWGYESRRNGWYLEVPSVTGQTIIDKAGAISSAAAAKSGRRLVGRRRAAGRRANNGDGP